MPSGTAAEESMEKTGPASEEEDEEQKDPIHEFMHEMEIQVYKMFKTRMLKCLWFSEIAILDPHPGLSVPDMYGHRSWKSRPVVLIQDVDDASHIDLVEGFSEKQVVLVLYPLLFWF